MFFKLQENLSTDKGDNEEPIQSNDNDQTNTELTTDPIPDEQQSMMDSFNEFKLNKIDPLITKFTNEPLIPLIIIIIIYGIAAYIGYKQGINRCIFAAKNLGVPVCPNSPAPPATE